MTLSDAHRASLRERGFAKVEGVVPERLCRRLVEALPAFSSVRYDDPGSWYDYRGVVIPTHHHQTQWDLRQHPGLHEAFAELWGTRALWVTMDRVGFVPPFREGCRGPRMHWDRDPRLAVTNYQAIVYVTDADEDRAPFCALPQVFRNLPDWVDPSPGWNPRTVDFSGEPMTKVPGCAGDLVVWDARLPHGPGLNASSQPRMMQAVSLFPAPRRGGGWPGERDFTAREQVEWWSTKRAPPWWRHVPLQIDPEPGPPARLTPLGRRLIGLDPWDAGQP